MKPTLLVFVIAGSILLGLAAQSPTQPPEAVTGFDDQSNGFPIQPGASLTRSFLKK